MMFTNEEVKTLENAVASNEDLKKVVEKMNDILFEVEGILSLVDLEDAPDNSTGNAFHAVQGARRLVGQVTEFLYI